MGEVGRREREEREDGRRRVREGNVFSSKVWGESVVFRLPQQQQPLLQQYTD